MRTNKGLVIVLTVLFVTITFAPCIKANFCNASAENKLANISVEIYGLDRAEKKNIQLTKQDALELETIFNEMKIKLDNENTNQKTIEIFNEAVESLDEFGLLPKDMSVKDMQNLVTNIDYDENILDDDNENFNCYIFGNTSCTTFYKPIWSGLRIDFLKDKPYLILFNGLIGFGVEHWDIGAGSGDYYKKPASGWIWTKGTNGVKTWEGETLWGNLDVDYFDYNLGLFIYFEDWYFRGVNGFTGIKIKSSKPNQCRFFGIASHVNIVTEFLGGNSIDPQISPQSSDIREYDIKISNPRTRTCLRFFDMFPILQRILDLLK